METMITAQEMAEHSVRAANLWFHPIGSQITRSAILHPDNYCAFPPGWTAMQASDDCLIVTFIDEPTDVVIGFTFDHIDNGCRLREYPSDVPEIRPVWEISFNTPCGQHFLSVGYSAAFAPEPKHRWHLSIRDVPGKY